MTIEETQKAITELEANRAAHVEVMRPISEEFVALVAADLPARWDTIMSQWVDNFADIVEGLDDSELKQLKSSVADLSTSAEEVARAELSGPVVWSHENTMLVYPDIYRDSAPSFAERPSMEYSRVSPAIRKAEEMLIPRIEAVAPRSQRYSGSSPRWWATGKGKLTEPMVEVIGRYQSLHEQLQEIDNQLRDDRATLTKLEGQKRWKDA